MLLAACSSTAPTPVDPAVLDATLTTDPDNPIAGTKVRLKAAFTGAELSNSSGMTFEIRVNEKPILIEAIKEDNNTFEGGYTFVESGTYEVYLHLYTEDIHLTKKKQVVVQ